MRCIEDINVTEQYVVLVVDSKDLMGIRYHCRCSSGFLDRSYSGTFSMRAAFRM